MLVKRLNRTTIEVKGGELPPILSDLRMAATYYSLKEVKSQKALKLMGSAVKVTSVRPGGEDAYTRITFACPEPLSLSSGVKARLGEDPELALAEQVCAQVTKWLTQIYADDHVDYMKLSMATTNVMILEDSAIVTISEKPPIILDPLFLQVKRQLKMALDGNEAVILPVPGGQAWSLLVDSRVEDKRIVLKTTAKKMTDLIDKAFSNREFAKICQEEIEAIRKHKAAEAAKKAQEEAVETPTPCTTSEENQ